MANLLKMCDEFSKLCRICLNMNQELTYIFSSEELQQHVASCLSITVAVNDVFPKNICSKCLGVLRECQSLREIARQSQEWLYTFIDKRPGTEQQQSLELSTLVSKTNDLAEIENNKLTEKRGPLDFKFPSDLTFEEPQNYELYNKSLSECAVSKTMKSVTTPYSSDGILDFLNDNKNVDQYISNEIPTIVNTILEQPNEDSINIANKLVHSGVKVTKITSTKHNLQENKSDKTYEIHMEIDVLDSDEDVVNEILGNESDTEVFAPKKRIESTLPETYSCMACKSAFNNFKLLTEHMSSCDITNQTCFECGKKFDSKQNLIKHRLSHKLVRSVCQQCGKTFENKQRLMQHTENCHNDFVPSIGCVYKCKECNKLYKDRVELYKHVKEHLKKKANLEINKCNICGKCFAYKDNLESHKQSKHPPKQTPSAYRCKACLAVFSDRTKLYVHVRQHTKSDTKEQHLCEACGKSFGSKSGMNKHMLTHLGHKYKCTYCKKICVDADSLQKHIDNHGNEPTICEVCGVPFMSNEALSKHMKEHSTYMKETELHF